MATIHRLETTDMPTPDAPEEVVMAWAARKAREQGGEKPLFRRQLDILLSRDVTLGITPKELDESVARVEALVSQTLRLVR